MSHLTAEQLSAMLDGALTGTRRESAERHLAQCASCREALAELSALEADLRPMLRHDPGDAYFESFAARVEDRIRAAGLSGAQSRLGGLDWLRSPRRLAWAGAAAAVIVGAGVVVMTSREVQPPGLESPLATRSEQRAEPPSTSSDEANQSRTGASTVAPEPTEATRRSQAGAPLESQAKLDQDARERQSPTEEVARSLARDAAPKRLVEVRRNASGEDVPVAARELPFAQAPRPEAAGGETELRAAKPKAAAPLAASPSKDEVTNSLSPSVEGATGGAVVPPTSESRLCGRVVDPQGRPVAGAVVALAERGRTASADADGRFCIDAPTGVHALTVMAVGYSTNRVEMVFDQASTTQVTLRPVSVLDSKTMALKKNDSPAAQSVPQDALGRMSSFIAPPSPATIEAERLSARAESLGTAPAFDAAAAAWERAVRASQGAVRLTARYRLAEARYQAWRIAPTAARVRAARIACDDYLAAAPAGARKDQVGAWRRQIR